MREQIKRLKQLNDHLLGLINTNKSPTHNERASHAYSNRMTSLASNNANNLSNKFDLLQLSVRKSNEPEHSQKHNLQKILKTS